MANAMGHPNMSRKNLIILTVPVSFGRQTGNSLGLLLLRQPPVEGPVKIMRVFLHIGAHRCATTSFQEYMRQNVASIATQGVGYWGPNQTRRGLFQGVLPGPQTSPDDDQAERARGRVQLKLAAERATGFQQLVISDENLMGSMRQNLHIGGLYSDVGERMARFAATFDDQLTDVVLNIRSLDHYWASALTYGVARGFPFPNKNTLDRYARATRSWRDVITDVALALPDVNLWVQPFDAFGGRPDAQLNSMTGIDAPRTHARIRLNRSPRVEELRTYLVEEDAQKLDGQFGRWRPFDEEQVALMREAYADDVMWLVSGADGLAQLSEDNQDQAEGPQPFRRTLTRGRPHDQNQQVAGSG
ncbi:hypothetical protein SAMN04488118_102279 [Epibacterium ulvae]|uniref:Uncharacterized protein n=2 Tax=Epibacterium ulvae TaxID=1156985 RepID=A0A1G5PYR7_9RHOB|nr:hypothetical protein SAMN04488118_102279 [Epibacterium ulvae]